MAGPRLPRVLVIVGPTGVGKTETACLAAQAIEGEVVSADSRQIYRGMDIGTGKPGPDELRAARHHMLDLVEPTEPFDAARFSAEARRCFLEIGARGRTPMLVGGTGLYVKAALEGLFPGPSRNEDLRRGFLFEEEREPGILHRRLGIVDPKKAKELSPRDLARIVRALEVYELTGKTLSESQAGWTGEQWPHMAFGLVRPRRELCRLIDARVGKMVQRGLIDEVKRLLAAGVPPDAPGLKSIGYREIVACLAGKMSADEAVSLVKRNSRRYAKRQMTWFRRMSVRRWITLGDASAAASLVVDEWRAAQDETC